MRKMRSKKRVGKMRSNATDSIDEKRSRLVKVRVSNFAPDVDIESKATTGYTLLDEKSLLASRCTCRIAAGLKQKQAAFTFGNFTQSVSHPHAARARPPRASRPRGGRKHR